MPTFSYQAYTAEGKAQKGRIEGLNAKEAREQLLRDGLYAREVRPLRGGGGRRSFGAGARSVFYRELGALLKAGLPLDRCLEILAGNPELGAGGEVLSVARDEVREGRDLSLALRTHLPGMREDEAAVVSAGEASGRLAEVSLELAGHLEEEAVVGDQVRGALVYPAVVAGLALLVLGVLVGFLLPVYEKLLTGLDQELPALTAGVLAFGRGVRHPLGLLALGLLLLAVIRLVRFVRRNPGRLLPLRRFRLPMLGFTLASLARARFARTLSLLLEGGVSLPEGLTVAGRATGSPALAERCRALAEEVSQGGRPAEGLASIPVLGQDLPGWMRAGEASGDLAGLMGHAARGHQRAWTRGLNRTLALLEPLLIVAVGLLILLVALAILLPMLRVNRGLGV